MATRATGRRRLLTTSGPGATNLVTGLATANMDSVPMVAITCQERCTPLAPTPSGSRHHRHHRPSPSATASPSTDRIEGAVEHATTGARPGAAGHPADVEGQRQLHDDMTVNRPGYNPTLEGHRRRCGA